MGSTATLPVWLLLLLAVAPATVTGTAAVLAAWVAGGRRASRELDHWRRREETMRIVRWASERAMSERNTESNVGLSVLDALDRSSPSLLQDEDQGILDAVIDAVTAPADRVVAEYPGPRAVEVEEADD